MSLSPNETTFPMLPPAKRAQQEAARAHGNVLLEIGALLDGHYEVQELLGAGGMAQVYLAFDRWLERKVAIKAAPASLGEHLAGEARVLASFQHPGLVAAHAYGYHHGIPYVVLEYLEGASLSQQLQARDRAQEGPYGADEAMRLATGICDALLPLHARGLVHCDLKPGNIMCAPARVVLIDLGLVWNPKLDDSRRRASGSPPFMAPEAISGAVRPGEEQLIDVYAIGMILYSLVAGMPAFADDSLIATVQRQLMEKARPLSTRRDGLPPRLSELVASLIDRDPRKRPPDVAHVRDALVGIPRRSSVPR